MFTFDIAAFVVNHKINVTCYFYRMVNTKTIPE